MSNNDMHQKRTDIYIDKLWKLMKDMSKERYSGMKQRINNKIELAENYVADKVIRQ
jgi:hypothetical protein